MSNRNGRENHAKAHILRMEKDYKKEIQYSIEHSFLYGEVKGIEEKGNPSQFFMNTDTVSALFSLEEEGTIAVLNFASYLYPGGGFINGSMAQEEALCAESCLYNVIANEKFIPFYEWNHQNRNQSLYTNRAIYSKDVVFEKDGKMKKADVITCAAPNYHAASTHQGMTVERNSEALRNRMDFIAKITHEQGVNTLIGGAFGCGVFGQDAFEVSKIWKELDYGVEMRKVVHAVPGRSRNAAIFQEEFKSM